jgi:hypothetical protein
MSKSGGSARARASSYSDATSRTFDAAVRRLEKALPQHHAALAELVDQGRFHDFDAIVAAVGGDR